MAWSSALIAESGTLDRIPSRHYDHNSNRALPVGLCGGVSIKMSKCNRVGCAKEGLHMQPILGGTAIADAYFCQEHWKEGLESQFLVELMRLRKVSKAQNHRGMGTNEQTSSCKAG